MNVLYTHSVSLLILLMLLKTAPVLAQSTGNATLTANLSDVLQVTINTATVSLNFTTPANYLNGVTTAIANQLTVTCNRSYDLKIKTSGPNMISGSNTIPVSNVSAQTTGPGLGTQSIVTALSTTDQSLATGIPPSMARHISMQYSTTAGNTAFLKPAGSYSTTLTFTAVAY